MNNSKSCFSGKTNIQDKQNSQPTKYGFYYPKTNTFYQVDSIQQYQLLVEKLKQKNAQPSQVTNHSFRNQQHQGKQQFDDFEYIFNEIQSKSNTLKFQQEMRMIDQF